jgi:hypothetical protein
MAESVTTYHKFQKKAFEPLPFVEVSENKIAPKRFPHWPFFFWTYNSLQFSREIIAEN